MSYIILAVFGGFSIMMLYVGITQYFVQRELTADPRRVTVKNVKSEVFRSESRDTNHGDLRDTSTVSYRPDVRFAYDVDGKSYESDLIYPTIIVRTYASHESAEDELRPFPVGASVEAYYGVNRPAQAYLVRETSAGPVVFIIVGLIVPVVTWLVVKYLI